MFKASENSLLTAFFSSCDPSCDAVVRNVLEEIEADVTTPHPNVQAVACDFALLKAITNQLCNRLDTHCQSEIVCHVSEEDQVDTWRLMHTRNLTELNAWVESHWVRQLIIDRRLTTFFQPIICNHTSLVFGYECLMRGLESNDQIVSPLRLIDAARKSGQLHTLDELARITAIENAANLCLETTAFFVNFSPRYMTRSLSNMQRTIETAMDHGVDPSRYVFEVTESDEIEEMDFVLEVLQELRGHGFRIALDDIGAGYNSLTRLAEVQPDFVKIDIELIRGIDSDPFKSRITAKLLELAQELEVLTIVEGVETETEWNWSRDHGADYSQGFFFAKPSPDPITTPLQELA